MIILIPIKLRQLFTIRNKIINHNESQSQQLNQKATINHQINENPTLINNNKVCLMDSYLDILASTSADITFNQVYMKGPCINVLDYNGS